MNYWASLWIGLIMFVAVLLNKRWATIITLVGFIPFLLLAVTGIIGPAANLVGQRPYMMLDEIIGTYVAGVIFGWLPVLLFGKSDTIR